MSNFMTWGFKRRRTFWAWLCACWVTVKGLAEAGVAGGCPEDGMPLLPLLLGDSLVLGICGVLATPTMGVVDDSVLLAEEGVEKGGMGPAGGVLRTAGDVCLRMPGELLNAMVSVVLFDCSGVNFLAETRFKLFWAIHLGDNDTPSISKSEC